MNALEIYISDSLSCESASHKTIHAKKNNTFWWYVSNLLSSETNCKYAHTCLVDRVPPEIELYFPRSTLDGDPFQYTLRFASIS